MTADERWMREALEEAQKAAEIGEVPIGAVIVREGEIVGGATTAGKPTGIPPPMPRCSPSGRRRSGLEVGG